MNRWLLLLAGCLLVAVGYLLNANEVLHAELAKAEARAEAAGREARDAKKSEKICDAAHRLTAESGARCRLAVQMALTWLDPPAPGQRQLTASDIVYLLHRDFTDKADDCLGREPLASAPR